MENGLQRRVPEHPGGFTMIEVMVVLVVVGVLLSVGAPSFVNLIRDNRLVSAVYDLRTALGVARSEALAQRAFVTVCSSNDVATVVDLQDATCGGTWDDGYIAFVDFNGDRTVDAGDGDEIVLAEVGGSDAGLDVALASAAGLRFDPRGTALGTNGTFTICDQRGAGEARGLFLSNAGQARSLVDTDDDGIVNLTDEDGGGNVTCP